MNILVVNDDGIEAIGIKKLVDALKPYGKITVSAPDTGRSACSHSIVLHQPLSFIKAKEEDGVTWYQTNGMPVDCVRLAVDLLNEKFDVVFSGINNGLNLGTDIIYSGTVGAAREANIEGISAVAISTDFNAFSIVDDELPRLLEYVFTKKLYSKEYVLNINFPIKEYPSSKGYRLAIQGIKNFKTSFSKTDLGNYKDVGEEITYDKRADSDVFLANMGYVTFVPLQVEQTAITYLKEVKKKGDF